MSLTIFLEGGGQSKDLRNRCREGFRNFLTQLGDLTGRPKLVACGTRADAFSRFETAVKSGSFQVCLLVDSEEIVARGVSPWRHVHERDGDRWERPAGAKDDHLHFMAVCMESWLVADGESLAGFFGAGFDPGQLPKTSNLEDVEKARLLQALKMATRTTKKGEYAKGKTSFAALGAINVNTVRERMSYCERFVRFLLASQEKPYA